jgi:hypothetical protein
LVAVFPPLLDLKSPLLHILCIYACLVVVKVLPLEPRVEYYHRELS